MRPGRAVFATLLLAAFAAAGCGDEALWARWRAERGLFHARRAAAHAAAMGRAVGVRERLAAEDALRRVADAFPPADWGRPPGHGAARDVALAAAAAELELARLAVARHDDAEALARWRAAGAHWPALPGVVVASRAGAAAALARLGRHDEALAERVALAALDPLGDPDRRGPAPEVLAAPGIAAAGLRERGHDAEARALLAAATPRFAAALSRAHGTDALAIARALADLHAALGDTPGALAALRVGLADLRAWEVPPRALALANVAFEAGAYDSALVYARWAYSGSNVRAVAGAALILAARAWEALGRTDSAFAQYDAVFERWTDPGSVSPEAHFRRACLLESLGQWERARSEFAALTAAAPSHPLAFESTLRVVNHHLRAGEFELARVEGNNGLDRMAYLLGTNRDPQVQRLAGLAHGQLLLTLGFTARAESTLVDLWRRFPEDSAAEAAALRGASLAEHRPGGRAAAAALYDELATHASHLAIRRQAGARLAELAPAAVPSRKEVRR